MKKVKQILAIIGIVLLVSLYVITLVLALTDDPNTMTVFRASLYCTFLIPVLIWAYTFIYKLLKNNYGSKLSKDITTESSDDETTK
ncbi:MAG: hypothetical protein MR020_07315 [Lachnospiraceae bacterium]|nr:hypothetical protein [Lachnospiraceae bacterium]